MKTAIVTGASSGIGKEIASHLSQKGWRLILLARRTDSLNALQEELPQEALPVTCDLSSPKSIEIATQQITDWTSAIHGLVNNAGIFRPGSVTEDTDAHWEEQWLVNMMGPVRLTRALWPRLIRAEGSSIVNISSTLGVRPIPGTGAYSATKGAMNNWTQTLAIEGASAQIRANAICPGICLLYTSPSPRDRQKSRMPSSA